MRSLYRLRLTLEPIHRVVRAVVRHRPFSKQTLHDRHCFLHAVDTDRRTIERDASHFVFLC